MFNILIVLYNTLLLQISLMKIKIALIFILYLFIQISNSNDLFILIELKICLGYTPQYPNLVIKVYRNKKANSRHFIQTTDAN